MARLSLFIFLLTTILMGTKTVLAVEADYFIEGTIYERENPGASVAIINGDLLKVGDRVGEYEVAEIYANGALLRHMESKAERSLLVGRDAPPASIFEGSAEGEEGAPGESDKGLFGGFGDSPLNPFAAMQKAKEAALQVKLIRMKIAFEQFFAENGAYPAQMTQLVEGDYITPDYLEDTDDYIYKYNIGTTGYELHIEPEKPSKNTYFYFLNESGILRKNKGDRAGPDSPIAK